MEHLANARDVHRFLCPAGREGGRPQFWPGVDPVVASSVHLDAPRGPARATCTGYQIPIRSSPREHWHAGPNCKFATVAALEREADKLGQEGAQGLDVAPASRVEWCCQNDGMARTELVSVSIECGVECVLASACCALVLGGGSAFRLAFAYLGLTRLLSSPASSPSRSQRLSYGEKLPNARLAPVVSAVNCSRRTLGYYGEPNDTSA